MEMPKIIKIGNSKGITIPHNFCKKLGLRLGDFVEARLTVKDEIIIKLHVPKKGS